MDGRELLAQALREVGVKDLASHMRGCDLERPITQEVLSGGTVFDVWVRASSRPGNYGAPQDEDPASLGIILRDRQRQRYRVLQPFSVVRCTARDFEPGIADGIGGTGGGTQYILSRGWLECVERIL